jgi:hypothetical protein
LEWVIMSSKHNRTQAFGGRDAAGTGALEDRRRARPERMCIDPGAGERLVLDEGGELRRDLQACPAWPMNCAVVMALFS